MVPYYQDQHATIYHGDCLEVLPSIESTSIDAVVTDPPYGLGFMGKQWDSLPPGEAVASELLRVLKPGGHLVAFGGTRTYHRLATSIEDAGFEIRDCLVWLYGSGFPKSHNLAGDREGWGTALKPAFEPIVLARKPLEGTVAANVAEHGTGALNIAATRIGTEGGTRKAGAQKFGWAGSNTGESVDVQSIEAGRWPANVLLDPEAGRQLDEEAGEAGASGRASGPTRSGESTSIARGQMNGVDQAAPFYEDSGGPSRFFYTAKASRAERNAGLDGFAKKPLNWSSGEQTPGTFQSEGTDRSARNYHPTVKPIDLMRWLVRLITPPRGLVLDPFTGSGTTGIAATLEGFRFLGIEREPEYLDIAQARVEWWRKRKGETIEILRRAGLAEKEQAAHAEAGQATLDFGEAA